jgi:hypothetical protein
VIPGTVRVLAHVLELECAPPLRASDERRLSLVAARQSSGKSGSPLATVRRPATS